MAIFVTHDQQTKHKQLKLKNQREKIMAKYDKIAKKISKKVTKQVTKKLKISVK